MEASFSSQLIALYTYDTTFEVSTRIFEMFLLQGDRVIIDLIASLLDLKWEKLLELEDLDLMNYLRKDLITEALQTKRIEELIPD